MFKTLLRDIRAGIQWLLHVCLIPVLAVLKGANALLIHLITELSKV